MPENTRPTAGQIETRALGDLSADQRRIRGRIPYSTESRDMGGWREVIEPGALANARLDDLVATVDHRGLPLGRYPTTLVIEDRSDGLHWSVEPPESRADVREAVERGDLRSGSWRMRVARDEWRGDVRHVHEIAELRDVAVATTAAYPAAAVELRTAENSDNNGAERQEGEAHMPPESTQDGAAEERSVEQNENENTAGRENVEQRADGGLQVEDRAAGHNGSLVSIFESRGWPNEAAEISWDEYRTATFAGTTLDALAPLRAAGVPLGQDSRYAFPAFGQVAVGADATSVQVLRQSDRTLPAAADVVRDIDEVTAKPEVATETEVVTVALNQVAAVESNIPNILLEQQAIESVVSVDLRLALNEGLDNLVLTGIAGSGFLDPGTDPLLVAIRKAITVVQAAGYVPNTVILTPADAETLDTLRAETGTEFYVFPPGSNAPRSLFGLNVRISKTIPAPAVVDATALGRLYVSPIELARFEADGGTTNRSNVRLEGNAAFGVERSDAAVRIAAA